MAKVAIIMGSKSDYEVVKPACDWLKKMGVEIEVRALSAHRTPNEVHEFASTAIDRGVEVIIAAAGKAAHLAGVVAGTTTLPVIGLPVLSSATAGLDALLSMVQMPPGVPVGVMAINGALNAGIFATQILAIKHDDIRQKLYAHKTEMANKVIDADKELQELCEITKKHQIMN